MKWSSVFLVSLTATGLLLSSCEGPVPVGLLLPTVTDMGETVPASGSGSDGALPFGILEQFRRSVP